MEKQIEKMAQDICRERTCPINRNGGECYKKCKAHIYAKRAIDAGYSKRVDVALEIFAEIDKVREDCTIRVDDKVFFQLAKFEKNIDELKNKYTEGE